MNKDKSQASTHGLDPSLITIVKPGQVAGPSVNTTPGALRAKELLEPYTRGPFESEVQMRQEKCALCCAFTGTVISSLLGVLLFSIMTAVVCARENLRVPFKYMVLHSFWMCLPSIAVCTTLHFWFANAVWSTRRNSFGVSWMKGIFTNTAVWLVLIAAGTATWRIGLRKHKWYRMYPIPMERLEKRLLLRPDMFWKGMGTTYWLTGLVTGQLGFATTAMSAIYTNKLHWVMSPQGWYSHNCLPPSQRRMIAQYTSTPTV